MQLVHVEQLTKLADLIKQSPSLQKDGLMPVLKACLNRDVDLLAVLEELCIKETNGKREKIKLAFKSLMKEKKVSSTLAALEQQKSLLAFYVKYLDS
jgi:hypothetical protein